MAEYFNRENVKRLLHIEYAYAAEQLLDEIPSDDVAPVVHGQWISKNTIGYDWTFVCSNCGYIDGYPFNDRHNFAPTAGPRWTDATTLNVERPASCESALRGLQHQLID